MKIRVVFIMDLCSIRSVLFLFLVCVCVAGAASSTLARIAMNESIEIFRVLDALKFRRAESRAKLEITADRKMKPSIFLCHHFHWNQHTHTHKSVVGVSPDERIGNAFPFIFLTSE